MRLAAIALFVSIAAISASGGVIAGELATGTITGVVFDDINGDGVQDEGEPGLAKKDIRLDGVTKLTRLTSDDGSFSFDGVDPGDYVLSTNIPNGVGLCADFAFTFDPLVRSWCLSFALPWHATPEPVPITVEPGSQFMLELPTRPADVAFVTGIAILEDDYAPDGTAVTAFLDGQECGSTTTGGPELNYELFVLGARERGGCADPGDTVTFEVGGVPVQETITFTPFVGRPRFNLFQLVDLVAMENYAWYWFESDIRSPLRNNVLVEALVSGIVCGEAEIEVRFPLGFGRLIVPSEAIERGCGLPGVDVTFRVDGVSTKGTVAWEAGLQRIDLAVSGDANCDMTLSAIDATLLLQLDAGLVDDVPCFHIADVTGDGLVDIRDAVLILQFEAGLLFEVVHVELPGVRPSMPTEPGNSQPR